MTREDITRMAREAGLPIFDAAAVAHDPAEQAMADIVTKVWHDSAERFAALVAAAERNILAAWMIQRSYATGHGDTTEDLLKELEWQIAENWTNALVKGVEGEREACAQLCEEEGLLWGRRYAAAIRARGQDPMPLFDDWPGGFTNDRK